MRQRSEGKTVGVGLPSDAWKYCTCNVIRFVLLQLASII